MGVAPPRDLGGWLREFGWRPSDAPRHRSVVRGLRDLHKRKEVFTLPEIMDAAGLKYRDIDDRGVVSAELSHMRKPVVPFMLWYKKFDPDGQEIMNNGFTDETRLRKVRLKMNSMEIFPVGFDRDIKAYRPLDLKTAARIVHLVSLGVRTTYIRRTEEFALLSQEFKKLDALYDPPRLHLGGGFLALPKAMKYRCRKCGVTSDDKGDMANHMERQHPA